ncbi:sensor histidine kinase [Mucilaginibacter aquaedulcis]|uniref:sensor histidine kinase n=1 Tax=Mucilaginibacter aquaedulcis TaxID=1187081 RepID=UPI0025B343EC|nr:histidine kinase [Mucilaginibacter aquaedulcis]MDN3548910.1 histidine kinase [Mucilaginibacter aquaedulcis]
MKIKSIKLNHLFNRALIVHGLCWALFICYEIAGLYYSGVHLEQGYIYVYYYSLNIAYFYLFVRILNFIFTSDKPSYFLGFFLLMLLFTGNLLAKLALNNFLYTPRIDLRKFDKQTQFFVVSTLIRTGYYTIIALFYWAAGHIAFFRKQALEAERERLLVQQDKSVIELKLSETRNAYLQHQINPHMLFNSLSFVYTSVLQQTPEAARSIMLLSDMLRFCLDGAGEDGKTSVAAELTQISNLIEINQQRFNGKLFLNIEKSGDLENYRIIPLILFTLVENLFKHGSLKNPSHPAVLRVQINAHGELSFFTYNLKKAKSRFARSTRIGIENIKKRMDFAYPGRYHLHLTDQETYFETQLFIAL